jgi:hypothetical protein
MHHLHAERSTQNQVMAVFEANALSFELPLSATLEDLAGRLAHLSERHGEALTGVRVRVSSPLRADPFGSVIVSDS